MTPQHLIRPLAKLYSILTARSCPIFLRQKARTQKTKKAEECRETGADTKPHKKHGTTTNNHPLLNRACITFPQSPHTLFRTNSDIWCPLCKGHMFSPLTATKAVPDKTGIPQHRCKMKLRTVALNNCLSSH